MLCGRIAGVALGFESVIEVWRERHGSGCGNRQDLDQGLDFGLIGARGRFMLSLGGRVEIDRNAPRFEHGRVVDKAQVAGGAIDKRHGQQKHGEGEPTAVQAEISAAHPVG